jgi:hypothetical protein
MGESKGFFYIKGSYITLALRFYSVTKKTEAIGR